MTPVCGGGGDRTTERGGREIELEREKETDTEQKGENRETAVRQKKVGEVKVA